METSTRFNNYISTQASSNTEEISIEDFLKLFQEAVDVFEHEIQVIRTLPLKEYPEVVEVLSRVHEEELQGNTVLACIFIIWKDSSGCLGFMGEDVIGTVAHTADSMQILGKELLELPSVQQILKESLAENSHEA